MDTLDERLVTLLRHDARRSVSDLAVDLGVSRATVRARMERLERSGDIIGYTVVLRADAVDQRIRGIMTSRRRLKQYLDTGAVLPGAILHLDHLLLDAQ